MTGSQIRQAFIDFFLQKDHKLVRSSSLVPHNDPTILFTNAGMNQFKDYFLGNQTPEHNTAVTCQKVLRAGGKHNDLENVGRTDRHHTFFEMLGNFSFGGYFKEEAIAYAWEFLTQTLGLDSSQLAVSVFNEDQEAYDIWANQVGIPVERIARLGEKENFWSMGDTGPCGPCSEIHFLLHPLKEGQTPQESLEADDGCFLEIWNLVFMQYNRDLSGTLTPLPNPSIDTGMGLERITSVVQGKTNNFETDLLSETVGEIAKQAGYVLGSQTEGDVSCRVIADHLRASVFLIADGVIPSNEGRGYVLRRIIRRAARHGKELGLRPGFFAGLVDFLVPQVQGTYPEVEESAGYIKILLTQEERRFDATLTQGLKILRELTDQLTQDQQKVASGESIFMLYDTYGFPPDLALDILEDKGLSYNQEEFEAAMNAQRDRAKNAQENREGELQVSGVYVELSKQGTKQQFVGYQSSESTSEILGVVREGALVTQLSTGETADFFLAQTPFYAEGGGQVGDQGELVNDQVRVKVLATHSPLPGLNLCTAKVVSGQLDLSQTNEITAKVDLKRRRATEANHTATHLLQAAMRTVIGEHVKQAGSLVNDEKLRFDFSHYAPVTTEEIGEIEALVNRMVRDNHDVGAEEMDFDQAVATGAMAIFGEKYGDDVRVVSAGDASKELCGGCHTSRTGNIGLFKIISEQAVSSGIRRIEAVTGELAFEFVQANQGVLEKLAQRYKVSLDQVGERSDQVFEQAKSKDKELAQLKQKLAGFEAQQALAATEQIGEVQFLSYATEDPNLRDLAAQFLKAMDSGVLMLYRTEAQKVSVVVMVSKDLQDRFKAGALIKELSPLVEGRGGGKPDFAQCGGTKPEGVQAFTQALREKLA